MPPSDETIAAKIADIEREMIRIGMWQKEPLTPSLLEFTKAFGGDKLAFSQWLQFVFVPRVRGIIGAGTRKYPSKSQVADQAFREWKMWGDMPDSEKLIALLRQFDAFFD